MPLGGYCETCGRWVWVTSYGECEHGHPASAVRAVQQLRPQKRAVARVDDGDVVPAAHRGLFSLRGRNWWWRNSLWIGWTFTLGFLNWLAFFYIGVRARRFEWIMSGFFYLIPVVVTAAAIGSSWLSIAFAVQLFLGAISILQAFLSRPSYRAIMSGQTQPGLLAAPPQPPSLLPGLERTALPKGIDEAVARVIEDAQDEVDEIMEAAQEIGKDEIRAKAFRLCVTAEQILTELRNEPRQVEIARAFLTYYLEAANRIVRGYTDLTRRGLRSDEATETLSRAEASLDRIQKAFDEQLARLVEHEVIDLDSEVALLEKTVHMENLYNKTGGS